MIFHILLSVYLVKETFIEKKKKAVLWIILGPFQISDEEGTLWQLPNVFQQSSQGQYFWGQFLNNEAWFESK